MFYTIVDSNGTIHKNVDTVEASDLLGFTVANMYQKANRYGTPFDYKGYKVYNAKSYSNDIAKNKPVTVLTSFRAPNNPKMGSKVVSKTVTNSNNSPHVSGLRYTLTSPSGLVHKNLSYDNARNVIQTAVNKSVMIPKGKLALPTEIEGFSVQDAKQYSSDVRTDSAIRSVLPKTKERTVFGIDSLPKRQKEAVMLKGVEK